MRGHDNPSVGSLPRIERPCPVFPMLPTAFFAALRQGETSGGSLPLNRRPLARYAARRAGRCMCR